VVVAWMGEQTLPLLEDPPEDATITRIIIA
jgi:hypothetical protein